MLSGFELYSRWVPLFGVIESSPVSSQSSSESWRPSPLLWRRFLQGGDGSFQVVWRTDLEVNLKRTQIKIIAWSYWPYIYAELFLEYSIRMRLLACAWAAETTASHGPHGKSFRLVTILSLRVKSFFYFYRTWQERNMLFVDRPVK